MTRESVALFGGSFNPPHVGHLLAITYVLGTAPVERVVVVPVFEHALRKQLAPFEHRVEMARRAFGWLPRVEVSTIEERLGAPSRTLSTILALNAERPEWALRLMVGSDIMAELHQWHAFEEVARRAPPLILPRAGAPHSAPGKPLLPEVSSTEIRQLFEGLRSGEPVLEELEALVPRAALEHALAHQLY